LNPFPKKTVLELALKNLLLFFTAFSLGKLILNMAIANNIEIAGWSSVGIALAALLIWGYKMWPGIFAASFVVNLTTGFSPGLCLGLAAGKTIEGLITAYFINRFAGGRYAFEKTENVLKFFLWAGIVGTAVGATFGVTTLCSGGYVSWGNYFTSWVTWWLGDMPRNLIVAPFFITWSNRPTIRWNPAKFAEAALMFTILVWLNLEVFGGFFLERGHHYSLSFICMPTLIWAAFRFSQRETAAATLVLTVIAVWKTLSGLGPFSDIEAAKGYSLIFLQFFISVQSTISMLLAAAVTQRRKALKALELSQAELLRSNTDLQRFASVAAHDLQEPLRMISNYLQLLSRRYKGKLDSDADEFIGFAVDGAGRMRDLLRGLVDYSRVDSKEFEFQPVSFGEVFNDATANLKVKIVELGAQVTHGPLPTLPGNRVQLLQLLQNLLANALKFHGPQNPEISLTAKKTDGEWVFECRDNGIGIDPRNFSRIFNIFQKLHTQAEYEGMGLGLAVCKRIAEVHGGRIWVESELGKGASFFFSLPAERKTPAKETEPLM